jgi:hypothetical protein
MGQLRALFKGPPKHCGSHKDFMQFHILRIPQYTNGNGYCMQSAARVTVCTMESSRRPQESEDWAKLRYLSDILSSRFFPTTSASHKGRSGRGELVPAWLSIYHLSITSAANLIAQCWQFSIVERCRRHNPQHLLRVRIIRQRSFSQTKFS